MGFLKITLLKCIILHGERLLGKLGVCLFTTHCRFLHTINNSFPIDVQLGKNMLKHSCIVVETALMKLLKVFLYHQSYKVFLHLVRIIVIYVINIRLCVICLDQISPYNKTNAFIRG